jgi:hypothetical protein
MLRVKYVVVVENSVMTIHPGAVPPLRRLELVGAYQIHGQRAEILRAMGEASFDPRKEVILEHQPDPVPANYALRAVALDRGKHGLRLEYAPRAFHVGAVVSAVAWATWIVAAVLLWRRERRLARA